ncbi:MAG: Protein TolB [Verrucomicrobiota bacterium]
MHNPSLQTGTPALSRPLAQRLFPLLSLSLSSLLPLANSLAQEAPVITITKTDKIALGLQNFSGPEGPAIAQIVQKDLQLSGMFSLTGPNSGNFQVSGISSGNLLRGVLSERSGKPPLLERSYPGNSRAQAHAFANDIVETLTGTKGIAGSRIAFIATQSGHKEIYLVDADGSNRVQLTNDRNLSVSPSLSNDGRKLLYTGYQSGYPDVYEIDLQSGARRRIMKYPGTNSGAAYSPDGSRIAVTLSKDGNPELYVTQSSGDSPRRLTMTPGVESSPTWSPDGREIIYSSDTSGGPALYRISASGGTPQLLRTGQSYNTEPNWSPDGKLVAFSAREGGAFTVAILELATGKVRLLSEGQDPVWGPNSRHLVYAQGSNLILLDTQTLQKTPIVSGLGKISEPSWTR